jgi:hypothetical protein
MLLIRSLWMVWWLVMSTLPCRAQAYTQLPHRGVLRLVAWWGIPRDQLTLARFEELREAGFNATFHNMSNDDELRRALHLGRLTGVKVIATSGDVIGANLHTIRLIKDSTALLAYSLGDEPRADRFETLGQKVRRIRSVDPVHPCYINLLPDCGVEMLGAEFSVYLRRAVVELQLSFLSFDIYPVTYRGVNAGWYDNLEKASATAREAGIPLWAFVLSTPHALPGTVYPPPSLSSLRLQAYSNLAYGVQAIQYFTYWLPDEPEYGYYDAPISRGRRTGTYDLVRQMNRELQAVAGVFVGAKVIDVSHLGVQPKGTKLLTHQPRGVTIVRRSAGAHLLVSQLRNDTSTYVVIQNCNLQHTLSVSLSLSHGVRQVLKNGKLAIPAITEKYKIAPGDVLIFDNTQALTFGQPTAHLLQPRMLMASVVSIWVILILCCVGISTLVLHIKSL